MKSRQRDELARRKPIQKHERSLIFIFRHGCKRLVRYIPYMMFWVKSSFEENASMKSSTIAFFVKKTPQCFIDKLKLTVNLSADRHYRTRGIRTI